MSVKSMMQTVLVTELRQIQPDISSAALQYVIDNFSQMFDVREILAEQNEQLQQFCLTVAEVQEIKVEAWNLGFDCCNDLISKNHDAWYYDEGFNNLRSEAAKQYAHSIQKSNINEKT